MNDFAVNVRTAALGNTYLFSVGQAGFIIRSARGQLLGIDLYLSECVERVEGHQGFKRLLPSILSPVELKFDGLVTTHAHMDHYDVDTVPLLMSNPHTKLYASFDCEQMITYQKIKAERVTYVRPGDHCVIGDFDLEFVKCDHGADVPDAVGIIVTVDGKKIFETGDTCLRLDRVEQYREKGPFDILIAPINGAFGNLSEQDCARLSGALSPRLTIPCHYGMFASHGGDIGRFYKIMTEQYPENTVLMMAMGERITL